MSIQGEAVDTERRMDGTRQGTLSGVMQSARFSMSAVRISARVTVSEDPTTRGLGVELAIKFKVGIVQTQVEK